MTKEETSTERESESEEEEKRIADPVKDIKERELENLKKKIVFSLQRSSDKFHSSLFILFL
jgi:hypothetical protein